MEIAVRVEPRARWVLDALGAGGLRLGEDVPYRPEAWEQVERGELPLYRGMRPTPHQLLVRELILQLKTGKLDAGYFRNKFGVDVVDHWRDAWQEYTAEGWLNVDGDRITLTRAGLLRVDALLPAFFEPEHQGVRYT